MNKLFLLLLFIFNGVLAGNSLLPETATESLALKLAREVQAGGYNLLSVAELKAMLDAKEDLLLLDAHPAWEYDLAYIEGAVNIGFASNRVGDWEQDAVDGHSQDEVLAALGADFDKKIVIYCGFTKCGRSHNAAIWVQSLGYKNVYRVPGGISAWIDSGFPYKTNLK